MPAAAKVRATTSRSPRADVHVPGRADRGCLEPCQLSLSSNCLWLACAEGDDAPDRVVRRNAYGHAISRHHLDSKAAHPAAQLGKHLVTLVTLDAVKTPAVNRHDRALHVNQIILAQLLPFPIKDCATFCRR